MKPAAQALDRAAVGGLRFEARWLAGQVALGVWDGGPARREALQEPVVRFLDAWSACPTSGWARTGLAEAYARAATAASEPVDLGRLRGGPWDGVGDDGRLAIGFARRAVRDEPNLAAHRDALVRVALRLGLMPEAEKAARGAATAMPDLRAHDFGLAEPPREVLSAFAEGSRAVLGRAPLLTRGNHLLALGLLEEKLGDLSRAETDLRASLREPAFELEHAERAYHLGRILFRPRPHGGGGDGSPRCPPHGRSSGRRSRGCGPGSRRHVGICRQRSSSGARRAGCARRSRGRAWSMPGSHVP